MDDWVDTSLHIHLLRWAKIAFILGTVLYSDNVVRQAHFWPLVGVPHEELTDDEVGPWVWGKTRVASAQEGASNCWDSARQSVNNAAGVTDRGKSALSHSRSRIPARLSTSTMSIEEVGSPVRLGAGRFATVYIISGGLIVFKEGSYIDNAEKLHQEYENLDNIHLRCNTDSFFAIPRALSFFNPLTEDFSTTRSLYHGTQFAICLSASQYPSICHLRRNGLFPATGLRNWPGPRFYRPTFVVTSQNSTSPRKCLMAPPCAVCTSGEIILEQLPPDSSIRLTSPSMRLATPPPSPGFCRCARCRVCSRRWRSWFHLLPYRLQLGKRSG